MHSILFQLIAVAASFVLPLPPGWCGSFAQQDGAETAPVKTACCHARTLPQSSGSPQTPAPKVECCCSRDATLPEKTIPPVDTNSVLLPVSVEIALTELGGEPGGAAAFVPIHSPSSLHILQCVWRC